MRIPLSVLDLSPVPAGGTPGDALRNTIDLAQVAERAGYRRYWVAEHHLVTGVASASPPVLVALLAGATERIRVGSGATLLPGTRPLQVAEQYGTTAAVHPGRIDLGLGRIDLARLTRRQHGPARIGPPPGGQRPAREVDGLLVPALPVPPPDADLSALVLTFELLGIRQDEPPPDYDTQVEEILSYLTGRATAPDGRPLHALPAEGADLDVWILGSTPGSSARAAGSRGLPFAANYHVLPATVLDTVAAYRDAFQPGVLERPHVMVSADVVVAETDERARELAAPYGQWVLDIRSGVGARPYVTPEQARAREWSEAERAAVIDRVDTQFVGSPETVVERLATLARVTGADELLVTTITTEHADRVRGLELLAGAWSKQSAAA